MRISSPAGGNAASRVEAGDGANGWRLRLLTTLVGSLRFRRYLCRWSCPTRPFCCGSAQTAIVHDWSWNSSAPYGLTASHGYASSPARCAWAARVLFGLGTSAHGYSLLTHEQLIDLTWDTSIVPLLLSRYPTLTPAELEHARAYAYGGCVIQDIGYYPFGDKTSRASRITCVPAISS